MIIYELTLSKDPQNKIYLHLIACITEQQM